MIGWLRRWLAGEPRRIERLADLVRGPVEVAGVAEAAETLLDPMTGLRVLAIDYRAWPPSAMIGMDGAIAHSSRAFQVALHQAVDFTLSDGRDQVFVRVSRGNDVAATHQRLLDQFGVGLRTEVRVIPDGARLVVVGDATLRATRSPLRSEPHLGVIQAARFWPADGRK